MIRQDMTISLTYGDYAAKKVRQLWPGLVHKDHQEMSELPWCSL
jgi:hypothetical protein